ncbi:sugar ABC transporter substrate-binding protein [Agilicoccus flavus]|uniref:sugar ABC transporter substrate-binding protein n=1 Tax=Agilicoccus flavus TaxID=2775968 RepID=UPI001CF654F1|nr:sugar ABC transporter substrate-binding protein [Agilicoccus flavus]
MTTPRRLSMTVAVGLTAVLGLSACSSSGGKQESQSAASGEQAKAPTMTVAFITHAAAGDTFWDLVRKGAEDAAKNDGVKLEYTSDPDGANQANLVKQAVDKKVDGIAVTLAKPDAMSANVEAATKAGIPVVALNAGSDAWKQMGVLSYFGQDEKIAGEEAGKKLAAEKATKALCVIQEQGHVGLEARCDGVKAGFPATEKLYVNGTDMGDVQSKVTSKLQQDTSLSHVIMLGAPFTMTAVKSIQESGSSAKLVSFDMNKDVVGAIKGGQVVWAVDQQPYLQGYLAVDSLWLNKTNGNEIGGGQPVLTGPAFVDSSNVAKVEQFANNGKR